MANASVIKQWETFLATSPLGISHSGPKGDLSALQATVQKLQAKLQQETGIHIILLIDVGPNFAQQQVQKIQQAKQQQAQPQAQPAEGQEPAPVTAQGELVKAWKKHLGVTNPEDPKPTPDFVSAIVTAENKLSSQIPTIKGLIWNPNKQEVNPQTPPAEYQAALQILQQQPKKPEQKVATANATMDALGPPPTPEERPGATRFLLNSEETKIETGDPMQTQMQGITVNKIPRRKRKRRSKCPPMSMGDRLLKLVEMMEQTKKITNLC